MDAAITGCKVLHHGSRAKDPVVGDAGFEVKGEHSERDGKGLGRLKVLEHAMQGEVHAIHATTASGTHR